MGINFLGCRGRACSALLFKFPNGALYFKSAVPKLLREARLEEITKGKEKESAAA